jgi:acetoin utilization deacetylase AcuC-like enzyme
VTQQQHQQHLQQQQQQQLQQQQQHPTQHMQSGGATASAAAAVAGAMQEAARPPAPTARPNVFTPTSPDVDTLCLVHDRAYVEAFLSGQLSAAAMRRIGLPWSQELVQRTLVGTGSAVLAARLALSYGVAIMCNGGTHHAHRDHGSGELLWATALLKFCEHTKACFGATGSATSHGGLLTWVLS